MPAPANVGGQAVIEGVMMRAASGLAVAVRRPSGEIVVKGRTLTPLGERFVLFKLPFLRGVVVLLETLFSGLEALAFSAEQATPEEESEVARSRPTEQLEEEEEPVSSAWSSVGTALSLAFALTLGIGLFIALPHLLTLLVGKLFGGLALQSVAFHLWVGLFKLTIFVGYLGLISLMPDIRRVFMYHGAEHKVIANHEAGEPLDVAHARGHTTFHARCGTSFLLVVVIVAIALFAVVFPLIPGLGDGATSHLVAVLIKVPMLLPIAGFAYELNRWAAKHLDNPLVRAVVAPGFLMQRLTTREPDDDMLEVAITSLQAALKRQSAETHDEDAVIVYRDFADSMSRLV